VTKNAPKRDAFVGMLPPKLAQIMINLAEPQQTARETEEMVKKRGENKTLLDPFCGTGVILQEAALMGYRVYGTDLADKMIDFSEVNLAWLADSHHLQVNSHLHPGDAMDTTWQQPIDAVACESYLGQPFSAPPSPSKLEQVRGNCNNIITSFLKNIGEQIEPGTPLCVGVPAWRSANGDFTHLPLIGQLDRLGYQRREFNNIKPDELLYYREDQVVARELLVLVKS
jgi:tRNA G10  N-methylase Trm11